MKNMPNLKNTAAIVFSFIVSSVYAENYCPISEGEVTNSGSLTKVYFLPTTYTDASLVDSVISALEVADFLADDRIIIDELPSSNSDTGPGSSEYDGLALAIAEKVLEQKNASADTAIDPYVDNVINFYNNGITNRQAVDIYRAGTNNGILTEPEAGFDRDISDQMGYVIRSEMRKTIERQRTQLQEGVGQVEADIIAGHRVILIGHGYGGLRANGIMEALEKRNPEFLPYVAAVRMDRLSEQA
ncbi:hypothetical protein CHH28_04675 [Bacterioplanes sanyensis]|uniref:Uncharacterized protein n=1 Tax=Bacterioplanes sanyensis TaxID=1249553 RepID=A0A222FG20_9GAMM|nr:hypothetical protein [Bacterioplanes sanyensis]ASP38017.1 hypothetical protein CHH28_04675 [Bacterioplanes sanyensis]